LYAVFTEPILGSVAKLKIERKHDDFRAEIIKLMLG